MKRLHPLSWVFALTGSIRQMIIPVIAILIFGVRDEGANVSPWVFALLIVVVFVRALWRQWVFRYDFEERALVLHEGLFFRNVRQIEFVRIENIDTQRGLIHRLLGVADVTVQTSTGGSPEAVISVLDLAAVEEMRARVFGEARRATEQTEPRSDVLLQLPASELVRYGLIDNRGMIIVAAAGGVLYELGFFEVNRSAIGAWLESTAAASLLALGPALQLVLAVGAVVTGLLTVRLLSIVLAVVTLYDFTLVREGRDLRARYGLFTRVMLTLRSARIQSVHQVQTFLHRWFNRVSLHADLAGDSRAEQSDEGGTQARMRWLAPVCTTANAPALVAAALPDYDLSETLEWRRLAPGARGRIARRTFVLWALITMAPALWYLREAALVVLLSGAPIAWAHAHLYVKHTAWALSRDMLWHRRGWLTRRVTLAPRDRVQSVVVHASPFDRRWRMASVFVDTAGGAADIHLRYLDRDAAEALAEVLYRSRVRDGVMAIGRNGVMA